MSRPKSAVCRLGHRAIVEGKGGRRWCRVCNNARSRRSARNQALAAMEAERIKAIEKCRTVSPNSDEARVLDRFIQRTEARMDAIEKGEPVTRERRKRVMRLEREDERLCEVCRERLFPKPSQIVNVEECP